MPSLLLSPCGWAAVTVVQTPLMSVPLRPSWDRADLGPRSSHGFISGFGQTGVDPRAVPWGSQALFDFLILRQGLGKLST